MCYADDTLLVARADTFGEARLRAEVGATFLIRAIERLGLRVSVAKTEAVAFSVEGTPAGAVTGIGGGGGSDWFRREIPGSNPGFAVELSGSLPPPSSQGLGHGHGSGATYRQYRRSC